MRITNYFAKKINKEIYKKKRTVITYAMLNNQYVNFEGELTYLITPQSPLAHRVSEAFLCQPIERVSDPTATKIIFFQSKQPQKLPLQVSKINI